MPPECPGAALTAQGSPSQLRNLGPLAQTHRGVIHTPDYRCHECAHGGAVNARKSKSTGSVGPHDHRPGERDRQGPVTLAKMGVTVHVIRPGDGVNFPKKGQNVTVHYVGTLTNGEKFDSSRDRGKPFNFKLGLGQVIRGWDEGVAQMSKGQVARLTCTPDYAYGSRGYPPVIPANATLLFDVELIDF